MIQGYGYLNEDSYLYIVDRKKDMINRGGEKYWCNDVENELQSLKGVKESDTGEVIPK